MKKSIKYIGVVFIYMLLAQPVWAADNCGDLPPCYYSTDVPYDTCCPVAVPFDGGLTLMLAAGGIGIGVKAMRKRKTTSGQ